MARDSEPSTNEKTFVLKALQEDVRLDGRSFDQYRDIQLNYGDDFGVADVSIGNTRARAVTSAEVTKPLPDRQFDGIFTISTELSPMASPAFEPSRPSEQEMLLSRLLEKTLRRSAALDTESLCLIAAQKVWSIRVDVHVLSFDGNLIDTCCIAVTAALQHFRRPDTIVEGEKVTIYTPREREPIPLNLLHMPFCATFSFYSVLPDILLLDVTELEESIRDGSMTISMNRHGEICQIAKLGGVPVDAVALLHCLAIVEVKVKSLTALVKRRLADDATRRKTVESGADLRAEHTR